MSNEFEDKSAQELLTWELDRYNNKIILASSFGAEDVVLIDMLCRIDPKARMEKILEPEGGGGRMIHLRKNADCM